MYYMYTTCFGLLFYIPLTEYIKFTTVNCILNQGIFSLANRMPKHADLHDQYKDFDSTDSIIL